MGAPIELRVDDDGDGLRALAKASNEAGQTRRLLALAEKVERGPLPAVDGVVRWRLKDLAQWIFEEFGVAMDCSTVGRLLRSEGFRKLPVVRHGES